jgi:hypothetical protein
MLPIFEDSQAAARRIFKNNAQGGFCVQGLDGTLNPSGAWRLDLGAVDHGLGLSLDPDLRLGNDEQTLGLLLFVHVEIPSVAVHGCQAALQPPTKFAEKGVGTPTRAHAAYKPSNRAIL